MDNFIIHPKGKVTKRAGTKFISECDPNAGRLTLLGRTDEYIFIGIETKEGLPLSVLQDKRDIKEYDPNPS